MNRVRTGKTHREKKKGVPIFDMNTKVAEGMVHAGLSQTAVEQLKLSLYIICVCGNECCSLHNKSICS